MKNFSDYKNEFPSIFENPLYFLPIICYNIPKGSDELKLRKILGKIFSQNAVYVILLLVQIAFLVMTVSTLRERFYFVYIALTILDVVLVIYIMNKNENPSYKLAWIIAISVFPIFGGIAYVFIKQTQKFPKKTEIMYHQHMTEHLIQNNDTLAELEKNSEIDSNLAKYIIRYGPFPVYRHTCAEYFPLGEIQFEAMKEKLLNAEKFIFMEYFIISEGYMFDTISDILIKKAHEGVDVRLMYDGIGTGMLNMSSKKFNKLRENGVKCMAFNPFTPFLSSLQNNRDHRKIIVIDGCIAFNGGTNLADEYINRKERFGHWKDTAIMITGEAVWNYTVMFLQLWEIASKSKSDYENFIPAADDFINHESDGFIQPFSDSPLDNEQIGKMVYMDLINNAKEYVYITTPYLILDNELLTALQFSAKKGVDVRIITPHIPDKWYTHRIAWNTYPELIKSGVKVYEYTPGFIHSKCCIADGKRGLVGTINLDFRSLYLHFESGAILYNCSVIDDIKSDFDETVAVSQRITIEDYKNLPIWKKIAGFILKIFAPLL